METSDLTSLGDVGWQPFPADFYSYILSNSALIASYPFIKNCSTFKAHGFPSVKVRVSALTASSYNTIVGSGTFTASSANAGFTPNTSAAPGSAMKAPVTPPITTTSRQADPSTITASKQEDPSADVPVESPSSPGLRPSSIASNPPGAPTDPSNRHSDGPLQYESGIPASVNDVSYSLTLPVIQVVAGSSIITMNPYATPLNDATAPVITIGGQSLSTVSASNYHIGGQTPNPGSPTITVDNICYSLAPSAIALVSDGSTIALLPSIDGSPKLGPPVIIIENQEYTANSASQYLVGTQTLAPGSKAVTVNDVPYSLAPSAAAIISGSITIPLASSPSRTRPPITIDGTTYTANSASEYTIGTQTLIPNGPPITIHSIPYALSLGPSAEALIVGTSTSFPPSPLTPGISAIPTATSSPNFTAQSHDYVIDGQTLTPGSEITASGTKISLGAQGTDIVVGGTTEAVGLGGVIMNAFGAEPTASVGNASGSVVGFMGGARREKGPGVWGLCGVLVVGVLVLLVPL